MIISGMTYDEIISEVKKDIPLVFEISDRKDHKVRRIVQKSQVFPVRLHSFVTSPNKNRWLLTWEAHSRRHVGDNIPFAMVCTINNRNGRIAIMPSFQDDWNLLFFIFLPHFFQRFSSRMGLDLHGEELIRRFFQYNVNFSIDTKKRLISETEYTIAISGTSLEGIALGYQLHDGSFFFKTFITYEMAKGDQIETFRQCELRRTIKHDEFLKAILQG
jgi:hypothetical protein